MELDLAGMHQLAISPLGRESIPRRWMPHSRKHCDWHI